MMNPQKGGVRRGSYPKAPPCTAPLKPVLCSVPGDLQQEWLYLKTKVFPQLNALCQSRGTCFTPVDVQWDIDLANLRSYDHAVCRPHLSSQQLKVSLDIITHSSLFICLLGHQYGPSRLEDSPPLPDPGPARELLSGLDRSLCVAAEGGYPWILAGKNQSSSVTELQVTQAALMGDQRQCFFYFRDYSVLGDAYEERDEHDEQRRSLLSAFSKTREQERCRVRDLKNRIVASLHPVRFFQTPEELGVLVMRDWKALIEQLCGAQPDQAPSVGHQDSPERHYHEAFIHYLCHWFVPSSQTTAASDALNAFTRCLTRDTSQSDRLLPRKSVLQTASNPSSWDSERSMVVLCGERGCGKTGLVAWWIQELRKTHPGILVIPYFCGISNSSVDIGSVLRQITVALRQIYYGSQPEWKEGLSDRIRPRPLNVVVQAFVAAAALQPCILVLDGLDRLTGTLGLSMQEVKELSWLPSPLPPQCKLILTTTSSDLTYKSLTLRPDVHTLPCPSLSDPGARRHLLLHRLTLPSLAPPGPLLQDLLRGRLRRLPLYLAVVAGELQTCGVLRGAHEMEGLMEGYMEVDSVAELWVRVVQRWSRDYDDRVDVGTPSRAEQTKPLALVSETELKGWVWDSLCLIHLSRSGLTEGQIWALLEVLGHRETTYVSPLEWACFRSAAVLWVQEKPSGALSFTHQSLSQAIDLLLMKIPPRRGPGGLARTRRAYYQLTLARYFQRQSRELGSWGKVLEEVPWLLEQCGAWGRLHAFLTAPETVEHLSSSWSQCSQLRIDIARFWSILSLKGYDPYASYQRLLGNEVHRSPSGVIDLWGPSPGVCTDADSGQREPGSANAFVTGTQNLDKDPVWMCESPVRARVAVFVSELLLCLSREQQAEQLLLHALDTLMQAGGEDPESSGLLLGVQHTLAELYVAVGRAGQAVTHFTSALTIIQTLAYNGSQEPEGQLVRIGQLLCTLCQLMFAEGCVEDASRILSDIISLGHHMVHPCAKATVWMLQALHSISTDDRNACKAESLLQAALEIRTSWYGGEHPLVVDMEERLADVWSESCNTGLKRTKAVEFYRHAVRVRGQDMRRPRSLATPLGQAKGCSLALTLIKLGRMLVQSSSRTDRREAEDVFQTALDLSLLSLGPEHTLTKDIQQIWTGAFRQTVASCDLTSRPLAHRSLRGNRPCTASTVSHRGASHTPSTLSRTRPRSGWSVSQSNLDPESGKPDQNHRGGPSQLIDRPWSVQTTVFGPKSDISNLTPRPKTAPITRSRSLARSRFVQRAGWCHLPGRYLLEDQTVTALSILIGPPVLRHRYPPMLRKTNFGPIPLLTEERRSNPFI